MKLARVVRSLAWWAGPALLKSQPESRGSALLGREPRVGGPPSERVFLSAPKLQAETDANVDQGAGKGTDKCADAPAWVPSAQLRLAAP